MPSRKKKKKQELLKIPDEVLMKDALNTYPKVLRLCRKLSTDLELKNKEVRSLEYKVNTVYEKMKSLKYCESHDLDFIQRVCEENYELKSTICKQKEEIYKLRMALVKSNKQ